MLASRTATGAPRSTGRAETTLHFQPRPGRQKVYATGYLEQPQAIRSALLAVAWTAQGPAFRGGRGVPSRDARPLLTVARDRLLIESLACDAATLLRLRIDPRGWTPGVGVIEGTASIPFDADPISQLLRMPAADRVRLVVGQPTVEREEPLPILPLGLEEAPRPWMAAFPALSAAAVTATTRIRLHAADLFSLAEAMSCVPVEGARAEIRLELRPQCAPIAHLLPGDVTVRLARSTHTSPRRITVEVPHARRLSILRDVAPLSRAVDVLVGGPAQPSTWTCRLPGASLSLVLGPMRSARGELGPWTIFQELEPWALAAQLTVLESLDAGPTFEAIHERASLPVGVVRRALLALVLRGRAAADPVDDLWFRRQLFGGPPPPPASRPQREERAGWLLESAAVGVQSLGGGTWRATLNGLRTRREVLVSHDRAGSITAGACGCEFAVRHGLLRGPCEHLLAASRVVRLRSGQPTVGKTA